MSYDMMDFPNTFEEYARRYGFKDVEEHYTNGSELIPVFRVNQWLEHVAGGIRDEEKAKRNQRRNQKKNV